MSAVAFIQFLLFVLLAALWGGATWAILLSNRDNEALDPTGTPLYALLAGCLPPTLIVRALIHSQDVLGEHQGSFAEGMTAYLRWLPQGQAALLMTPPAVFFFILVASRPIAPPRFLAPAGMGLLLPIVLLQSLQGHVQILGGTGTGLFPLTVGVVVGGGVDTIHLLAALTWVGGLLHLGVWLLTGRVPSRPALLRFSGAATGAVGALLLTGFATYWLHFRFTSSALFTPWGLTGGIKLALMLLMGGCALWNRRGIRREPGLPVTRLVTLELALGILVLGLASLLTQLDPHSWE